MASLRNLVLFGFLFGFLFGSALLAQTPVPVTTSAPSMSVFVEAGAAPDTTVLGGAGLAVSLGKGQYAFGEIATANGGGFATTALFGIKSDLPAMTISGKKITPFTLLGYGGAVRALFTQKAATSVLTGVAASTVTSLGVTAGFAQQYAGGFEIQVNGFNVGVAASGNDTTGKWAVYPLIFISRSFGK